MSLLYSNVPPLRLGRDEKTLPEYIEEKIKDSDSLYIAVGYASKKALVELNEMIKEHGVSKVVLVLGMYCIEGFPEGIYNTAIRINEEWKEKGIGEIRVTPSMKYHGKLYGFYQNTQLTEAVIGSHNLGSIVTDANNRRQYELSFCINDSSSLTDIDEHLNKVIQSPVSVNISEAPKVVIKHEENEKLNGVEGVTKIDSADVASFKMAETDISFSIPLKVPGMPGSSNDFMKSNVNKCYAKGRLNTRTGVITERGWWETEIIVSNKITSKLDYPDKGVPFYVITDDGWRFKAHASGDHKKNFESHDDLKILGYWLKGRLVAAGFVEPVDSPSKDLENIDTEAIDIYKNCRGVITYQKLQKYGRTELVFTKTVNTLADEDGNQLDVWVLSFLPNNVE